MINHISPNKFVISDLNNLTLSFTLVYKIHLHAFSACYLYQFQLLENFSLSIESKCT